MYALTGSGLLVHGQTAVAPGDPSMNSIPSEDESCTVQALLLCTNVPTDHTDFGRFHSHR